LYFCRVVLSPLLLLTSCHHHKFITIVCLSPDERVREITNIFSAYRLYYMRCTVHRRHRHWTAECGSNRSTCFRHSYNRLLAFIIIIIMDCNPLDDSACVYYIIHVCIYYLVGNIIIIIIIIMAGAMHTSLGVLYYYAYNGDLYMVETAFFWSRLS